MNKKSSQQNLNKPEDKDLLEKYEFRSIRPEEADEAATIE
jgi:hypothetical protein